MVSAWGTIFAPGFLCGRVAGMPSYYTDTACSQAAVALDTLIDPSVTGLQAIAGVVRTRLNLV